MSVGDLLLDRSGAEHFAKQALYRVFPALPRWGLHNDEWIQQPITVDGQPFIIGLSPWRGSGRDFYVRPARRKTPAVGGWADISTDGLWVQPEYYHRPFRSTKRGN